MRKTAIIIGAGPAGLTAAYELLTRTDIKPLIIEKTNDIGGISKTIEHNGNRIDLGGHRFFSKSDIVMEWWQKILPLQGSGSKDEILLKKQFPGQISTVKLPSGGPDPEKTDRVMLLRRRLSRIYFLRKFFDYPVTLNWSTIRNLGIFRIIKIGFSYLNIKIFPVRDVKNLEDFFISRFGKELYKTFFQDYTEKVWGVPCHELSAEWGAQRIKGLSVSMAVRHAMRSLYKNGISIEQKNIATSLIGQYLYPKYGPGQMWETVAGLIIEKGGEIIKNSTVTGLTILDSSVGKVSCVNNLTNQETTYEGDFFFSSMPVKDLIEALDSKVPSEVIAISNGLIYRDFITVGLLLNELKIKNKTKIPTLNNLIPDSWIYIQEREVKVGRLQIFNNWSPYMVADSQKVWIGLEYFCNEGDTMWNMKDNDFIQFAINELVSINIIDKAEVVDSTIIRMQKAYPAYSGTFPQFEKVRNFIDKFDNLFLIGRNGLHKYNNQDHSMLTAFAAVSNIITGEKSKEKIWDINSEVDYHEEK